MDLSPDGEQLELFVRGEFARYGLDEDLANYVASTFDGDDSAAEQLLEMLQGLLEDGDVAAGVCSAISAKWGELVAARALEAEDEADEADGEGADGGADAPLRAFLRADDEENAFAPDAELRAATLAAFYGQTDGSEEEEEWMKSAGDGEVAPPPAGGKGAKAARAPPPKAEPVSRVAAFDDFLSALEDESVPGRGGAPLGRRAMRAVKAAQVSQAALKSRGRGRGEEESEGEDEEAPAPAHAAGSVVVFDPLADLARPDNAAFAQALDNRRRAKLAAAAADERQREADKASAAKAAKELARNSKMLASARTTFGAAAASSAAKK